MSATVTQAAHELDAYRLRSLVRQFGLSRAESASLLREIASEFDHQPIAGDSPLYIAAELEADRLRAVGFTVTTSLDVSTLAAADVLGRAAKTLRNWRAAGTGPAWRTDGAGGVWYSLPDLMRWRDVPDRPDF